MSINTIKELKTKNPLKPAVRAKPSIINEVAIPIFLFLIDNKSQTRLSAMIKR